MRSVPAAVAVAATGLVLAAAVAAVVGAPASDAAQLVAFAVAGAAVAGGAGTALLHTLRRRSTRAQAVVVALTSVVAVGVGATAAAHAMFLSTHDYGALLVILVSAGTVGLITALVLGDRLVAASRSLGDVVQRIGDGGRPAVRLGGDSPAPEELAALGRQLEDMSCRLEAARSRERALDGSRRELVAWVSHDLRTPLAGIRAMVEALEDGVVTDAVTVHRYHRTMRLEVDRLAGLVDDLFELSRIQAGALELHLEWASLSDLVSDALAAASPVAHAKGVLLVGSLEGTVPELEVATPDVLRVLRNLLDNAIRHTPPEGEVRLDAGVVGDHAVVSVHDSCGGIPPAELDRVFDLAFRGNAARTPGGAGLGLAIARGIVEAHRGRHRGGQRGRWLPLHRAPPTARGRCRRMRVLVTGGSGFVGSHVVDALVAAGHGVRVLDRVVPPHPNLGAEYWLVDICHRPAWDGALDGVDAVCHQAARVGLGVDMGDVADYVSDNDAGTAELLLALHRSGFAGRLVLASSMVVYGEGVSMCASHGSVRAAPRAPADLDDGMFEPRCPSCAEPLSPGQVDEDAPSDPRNVYAATKLHQEHLCAAWGRETGAPVTALRYHNVYGPRMPSGTPYAGVASIFRNDLAAGRPPQVFEDGGQRRDFVHVTDVARANLLALTAARPVPGAFNVASGEVHTVGDLATALAAAANDRYLDPVITGRWRPGDVRHVVASARRAREVLGFTAAVPFAVGVEALTAEHAVSSERGTEYEES